MVLVGGVDEEVVLGSCFVNNEFEATFDGDSALSCWCVSSLCEAVLVLGE